MLNRWLGFTCFIVLMLVAVSVSLTVTGGVNATSFEKYYPFLITFNIIATVLLFAVIVRILFQFRRQWKNKQFGIRMTSRLAVTISLTAALPCVLLYVVSSIFIGRSVDSWFDTRVDQALSSGVALSSKIIKLEQANLLGTTQRAALILSDTHLREWDQELDRLRYETGVSVAFVYRIVKGKPSVSFSSINGKVKVTTPTLEEFRLALENNGFSSLEGDSTSANDKLQVRSLVPINASMGRMPSFFLFCSAPVTQWLATEAKHLATGYNNYQALGLSRSALLSIYETTLFISMLLALFGAIVVALIFSKKMTAPILQLAVGTKKVAQGRLKPIREFEGNDEINELTSLFNSMIRQISEAQSAIENQRLAADRSRQRLRQVLENISSGVFVLSDQLTILIVNASANAILYPIIFKENQSLLDVQSEIADIIVAKINITDSDEFHANLELVRADSNTPTPIFIRGTRLVDKQRANGWVVVFDDMTNVIQTQKALAWTEVARRLAHEIKNPLTPIRLAAERLEIKLTKKLDATDAALLHKTTSAIVTQVDALKQMVSDFREYAKLPSPTFVDVDINELLDQIIDFYQMAGVKIEFDLQKNLPLLEADPNQLQQVFHNLIGNAADAMEKTEHPEIYITTKEVRRRSNNSIKAIRITIYDNGPGFAPELLNKVFEPYVTTKSSGTGLGLPMVKKIIDEHHGKITVANRKDTHGAEITVVLPVALKVN